LADQREGVYRSSAVLASLRMKLCVSSVRDPVELSS
jgi:hypothetical protein